MNNHSEKFLRKRKALLVLPFVVCAFVTLAFWALGGGKGNAQDKVQQKQGINASLPDAQLSGASLDKMSLYAKAASDSQALKSKSNADLFAIDTNQTSGNNPASSVPATSPIVTSGGGIKTYSDPNEIRVRTKLDQLEQTLNKPVPPASQTNSGLTAPAQDPAIEAELSRLQQAMQQMNQGNGQDPEMQQLDGMLNKIMDIQHPDRVQQQLKEQSIKNKGQVFPVVRPIDQTGASLLDRNTDTDIATGLTPLFMVSNGFYDLDSEVTTDSLSHAAIPAVVQETQTVVSGSTIKLRLTEDVFINGVLVPKNNFLFGNCSVDGERLKIAITGIRYQKNLFPVSLSVYDLDALEGIRVPGAISRDASKEGADRALQSVQLMSLDPSIGAQAAGAGLEAAKGLFSKKVKLIRVTVKAGYPILLMDQKAKETN